MWHSLCLAAGCGRIFFVKLQTYTLNGSDRVCGGICFHKFYFIYLIRNLQLTKRKVHRLIYILIYIHKGQTFAINKSDKVCDEVCFSEGSSHYYE